MLGLNKAVVILCLVGGCVCGVDVDAVAPSHTTFRGVESHAAPRDFTPSHNQASADTHRAFRGSDSMVPGPERGFRYELDQLLDLDQTKRQYEALKPYNVTVAQSYVYLPWQSDTLPAETLSGIEAGFAFLRSVGLKALLRFAYDLEMPGEGDYTFDRIQAHIKQLTPIVRANMDVIYVLQAGFVGSWGEWHDSKHKLEEDHAGLSSMLAAQLQMMPPDRKVQVRVPLYKAVHVLRPSPPPRGFSWKFALVTSAAEAALNTPQARIGHNDDGFLNDDTDGNTWEPTFASEDGRMVDWSFNYMTAESPFVPVDGEMFWHAGVDYAGVDGHLAAHRMRLQHYTTLSHVHGFSPVGAPGERRPLKPKKESIDLWMTTPLNMSFVNHWHLPIEDEYAAAAAAGRRTIYEYIRDHLGYRIKLASATYQSHIQLSQQLHFDAVVENYGFSAPVNPRRVSLVLLKHTARRMCMFSVANATSDLDVRTWQPYIPQDPIFETVQHSISLTADLKPGMAGIPSGCTLTQGSYALGLWLPDARSDEPSYAMRFANSCSSAEETEECDVPWWEGRRDGLDIPGVNIVGHVNIE